MKKELLILLSFLCVTLNESCATDNPISVNTNSEEVPSTVSVRRYTIPVLTLKDTNPVLNIVVKAGKTTMLKMLNLNLSGTTDLGDIARISIYRVSSKGMIDTKEVLATSVNIKEHMSLPLLMHIEKNDTFALWVSIKLKDKVKLTNKYNINCTSILTDQGTLRPKGKFDFPLRAGVALRQHEQGGVNTSRIPGLTSSKNGTLIAIYDARYRSSRDLQGDIDICCQRSTDGGETWGPMIKVLDMKCYGNLPEKYNGVSDAAILCDRNTGTIFVAATWMYGVLDPKTGQWVDNLTENSTIWNHQWASHGSQPGLNIKQSSQLILAESTDDGKTWSNPINITAQVKNPKYWLQTVAPGNGITLHDGTLVFPAQGRDESGQTFSNIIYSGDHGITWTASNPAWHNTTECAVVERIDGSLMLNMRDNTNRKNYSDNNGRRICISSDMGTTWTEHSTSHRALIEPVCMASLYQHIFKKGAKSVLLFSNPDNKKTRTHMTIKSSYDDGETWTGKKILLDELAGSGYSCITSIDDQHIGILYEGSQCNMVFQVINLNEIL